MTADGRAVDAHGRQRGMQVGGEGQIAEKEFRNPRWVPGKLKVLNRDRIVFSWMNCGEVEFRRDD